jgi:MFS family permease
MGFKGRSALWYYTLVVPGHATSESGVAMGRLLTMRNAQLYLAGTALSLFGDTALFLAVAVWVKILTGSNGAAGLIFFILGVPALFAPASGLLVDRVRRRPLLMLANVTTGAMVLLLLLVHGKGDVWLIYLVVFLYGASYTIINSAQSAMFTVMLPRELLGENNAAMQTIWQALHLVGPMAGAALFAWRGGAFVAILDALTFFVAALAIGLVRVPEAAPERRSVRIEVELLAGVQHIIRTVRLRQLVLVGTLASCVFGFGQTVIFAVVDQGLHRPPTFLGVLVGVMGIGGLVGGVTAARVMSMFGEGMLTGLGLVFGAIGSPLLALPSLAAVVLGVILFGIGLPWIIVGTNTLVQRATPAPLQGRVSSAVGTMLGVPQIISIALGAALITVFDYRVLVLMMAAVLMAGGTYLLTRVEQRGGPPNPEGSMEILYRIEAPDAPS